jgi:8-oxo-dGTP diphosphatase
MPTKKKVAEKRTTWVAVVTAIIRRQGKILVGRRPAGGALPDVWEFPGGKIEAKESPEDALKRELNEELGIEAEIGKLQYAGTFTYGKRGLLFLFYDVKFWKGEIKPEHHTDLKWISPKELQDLALPDANRAFLEKILPLL